MDSDTDYRAYCNFSKNCSSLIVEISEGALLKSSSTRNVGQTQGRLRRSKTEHVLDTILLTKWSFGVK